MSFDALALLRQAGSPVDLLTSDQRATLAGLTEAEVDVLVSVQQRLNAGADSEVECHSLTIKIV